MNPTSGKHASLVIPRPGAEDLFIPMGGPLRGIVKAVAPRETSWSKGIPVPFANLPGFFANRLNPLLAGQWDLFASNRDFQGGQIRSGDPLHQFLDSLQYELETVTPLTLGTGIAGIRQGKEVGDIVGEMSAQFGGVNVQKLTPFQIRDKAVIKWAKENGIGPDTTYQIEWEGKTVTVDQTKELEGFYDLQPTDQKSFEAENLEIFLEIEKETKRRAKQAGTDVEGKALTEGPMGRYVRRVEDAKFEDDMVRHQEKDDAAFDNGKGSMGGEEWRDLGSKRDARIVSHRLKVYGTNLNEPEDVLDYFYAKIREVAGVGPTDEEGAIQWPDIMGAEEWEEVFDWVEEQPQEAQDYIERNSGLKTLTPARAALKEAQEYLKPFWGQKDYVLDNPGDFGIPPEFAEHYREVSELKDADQTLHTTPVPGDSAAVIKRKEYNRKVINAVGRILEEWLHLVVLQDPKIQSLLVRYEYSVTKELIQLQALRELEEANR
jgi:hypothetical protein